MIHGHRHITALLVLLAMPCVLPACAPVQVDPEDALYYELLSNSGPPWITRIVTTNGAGKILTDGRPGDDGNLAADPDLGDLDGTLVITVTWSDGKSYTHSLTHTPNRPVNLTYNNENNRFEPTGAGGTGPGASKDGSD